ncbi:MAG: cation transporter [Oscillospiraceae bacterium]|nr:cation transporter [Oscillospiraceae bacterium]
MLFFIYFIIAFFVIYFSFKCAYYLDIIEAKTNLSGLFLSSIILASITSLPELVTSVSAISFLDNPGLVLGNVLGSNIFNLTILASLIIIFFKRFLNSKIDPLHDKSLYLLIIIYSLVLAKMHFDFDFVVMSVDIVSILIGIFYLISLKFISVNSEDDPEDSQDKNINNYNENIKNIIIKFIFASMGLVISSVAITVITDKIVSVTNIGATLAGALLLGIATSIPELATSIALCKLGNFNGVFGNMIGSCIFNYIIITIGDILYNRGSIYIVDNNSYKLTVFGLVTILLTLIILKTKVKNESSLVSKTIYILSSLFIISSYFLFLFL